MALDIRRFYDVKPARDLRAGDVAHCHYTVPRLDAGGMYPHADPNEQVHVSAWVVLLGDPETASGGSVRFTGSVVDKEATGPGPQRMVELTNDCPVVVMLSMHGEPTDLSKDVLYRQVHIAQRENDRLTTRLALYQSAIREAFPALESLMELPV